MSTVARQCQHVIISLRGIHNRTRLHHKIPHCVLQLNGASNKVDIACMWYVRSITIKYSGHTEIVYEITVGTVQLSCKVTSACILLARNLNEPCTRLVSDL